MKAGDCCLSSLEVSNRSSDMIKDLTLRVDQSETNPVVLVVVAETRHRDSHLRQAHLVGVELSRGCLDDCESIILTWDFGHDLTAVEEWFSAHTHAARGEVVDALPAEAPLSHHVIILDALGSHDDLTSVALALVGQV